MIPPPGTREAQVKPPPMVSELLVYTETARMSGSLCHAEVSAPAEPDMFLILATIPFIESRGREPALLPLL